MFRPFQNMPLEFNLPKGGILADEMGLGKTVEILALILKNQGTTSTMEFPAQSEKVVVNEFSCICGDMTKDLETVCCSTCKSVQHIECINWNISDDRSYFCPHCLLDRGCITSRATLIVTPQSICAQWADEIRRHLGNTAGEFKTYTYQGVNNADHYVQPFFLADNDVVLVSFETLRSELANANLQSNRSCNFRTTKRFMAVPSPLPAVQ